MRIRMYGKAELLNEVQILLTENSSHKIDRIYKNRDYSKEIILVYDDYKIRFKLNNIKKMSDRYLLTGVGFYV